MRTVVVAKLRSGGSTYPTSCSLMEERFHRDLRLVAGKHRSTTGQVCQTEEQLPSSPTSRGSFRGSLCLEHLQRISWYHSDARDEECIDKEQSLPA